MRLPASYCGVVGFKPGYGRISRHGLVPYASSLDTIGIISDSMELVRTSFDVLKGSVDGDMTAWQRKDPVSPLRKQSDVLTVGLVEEMLPEGVVSPGALHNVELLLERLKGVRVKRVSLPSLSKALWTYYVLSMVEASSCLARFSGRYWLKTFGGAIDDYGLNTRFGAEVRRRLVVGNAIASATHSQRHYQEALTRRAAIRAELSALFHDADVIVSPTAASGPPLLPESIGGKSTPPICVDAADSLDVDGDEEWAADILTVPASLAGLPAISVPVGPSVDPASCIGVQLMAPHGRDEELLALCLEELHP